MNTKHGSTKQSVNPIHILNIPVPSTAAKEDTTIIIGIVGNRIDLTKQGLEHGQSTR
jgi:hypothetical protein